MQYMDYPTELWSEIVPGLWQGGTDDYDVIGAPTPDYGVGYTARKVAASGGANRVTRTHFDCVVTLYARANGASWNVKEIRYGFSDGDMTDFDPESDLWFAVREAHADWKAGKRVLIRCQAGLNRSGLITALVLIRDGMAAADAIELIREKRAGAALCNITFERWLLDEANVDFWRAGVQQDAA
jgi:hypothetical protein